MRISDWSSDVCSSDLAHAGPAHAGDDGAKTDADRRYDHHQCLVARIAEDHRDEAEGVDRLGEPVIGVEARIDRERGRSEKEGGEGGNRPREPAHVIRSY